MDFRRVQTREAARKAAFFVLKSQKNGGENRPPVYSIT
jgi:hypothetical protein